MFNVRYAYYGLFCAGLILIQACNPGSPTSETPASGQLKETQAFWESLQALSRQGAGVEVLSDEDFDGWTSADLRNVFEDVAEVERTRAKEIYRLPLRSVDLLLSEHAARAARMHESIASALQNVVILLRKEEEMLGGDRFLYGMIENMFQRRDQKDGLVFDSFVDQLGRTMEEGKKMQPAIQGLEEELRTLARQKSDLRVSEMQLRIQLTQRYQAEFEAPAFDKGKTTPKPVDNPLSERQIMEALIGHRIQQGWTGWTFESMQEFVSLQILSSKRISDEWVSYDVVTKAKGMYSGNEREFRLTLMFRSMLTRLKLVQVVAN